MFEKVYDILTKGDEITWKNIIYGLIKSEKMNPWDVDVSLLTQKYLEAVKQLQETNFFLSGKVLLASAMLVKIKSQKFIEEDISNFDNILFQQDEIFEELDDFGNFNEIQNESVPELGIKTPQARKRRVSVNDLIHALERALEVNKRRIIKRNALWNFKKPEIPEKAIDMNELMKKVFEKIKLIFKTKKTITFTKLLPQGNVGKKDKILTLYPLLHLVKENKIDMYQQHHFGEIDIYLKD
ncbi:MAG: segregation/condensation protein A [Nanoarchaeota archaeon]|nr:segregation/condensation protein A [Nanoarchaeota archaeon]